MGIKDIIKTLSCLSRSVKSLQCRIRNTQYGSSTLDFNETDTVFTIPHSLGSTPSSVAITYSDPTNTDIVDSIITVDSTNITLTASTPPTGSITVYWQVFK